jgi:meso-butanediol dehydrogenase / (S,S)-butanediol dehydrogenase / diacetyl reductase
MNGRFANRTAVVTGGAQGMGRAIAQGFASEGARVLICDINGEGATRAAKEIGSGVQSVQVDVSVRSEVEAFCSHAVAELGRVDVFVNNAGIVTMAKVTDLPEDDWDRVMDVNAKSVFLTTRAIVPHMLDHGGGAIVNIASQAGKRGYGLIAHYCASKAAVMGFSKSLALEVAPTVRVNCVCPGVVSTPMVDQEFAWQTEMTGESVEEITATWVSAIPMGRFQQPENIADVVLFLASDAASEMTGQCINVTGGMVTE